MRRSNLQPGSLLTREERWQLRLLASDIAKRLERALPHQIEALERQAASVHREQMADKATRPKRSQRKGRNG